jgi:hypothetical protein
MNELFPVICGTVVGLCSARARGTGARRALWIASSLVCGATATLVSGEYKLGPQYLAFDTALAAAAAIGANALGSHLRLVGGANQQG